MTAHSLFDSYEQRGLRAVVVTKGLTHPWSVAFLPDGAILITERQGPPPRSCVTAKLDPTPVAGTPAAGVRLARPASMDIALHPRFAQKSGLTPRYHKPHGHSEERRKAATPPIASNAILRATWDGKALTEVPRNFVADDVDMEASRLAFGPDGMLYIMGIGGPGTGSKDQHGPGAGHQRPPPARSFA